MPDVADKGVHAATGVLLTLLVLQVVATQPVPADAAALLQEGTGVGPVLVTGQVVVVQLLRALPPAGEQVAGSTGVGPVTRVGHVVVVQKFAAVGPIAKQVPEGVLVLLLEQLVVVQALPAVAAEPVHEDTAVGPVVFVLQVVVVQLLSATGPEGLQVCTATLLVLLVPQVVVV